MSAKGRQIETEAAPIRCVAELFGADADSERTIRWLIALMVMCCDTLAMALTAAAPLVSAVHTRLQRDELRKATTDRWARRNDS